MSQFIATPLDIQYTISIKWKYPYRLPLFLTDFDNTVRYTNCSLYELMYRMCNQVIKKPQR